MRTAAIPGLIVAFGVASAAPTVASAQSTIAAPPVAAEQPAKKDKMICRREQSVGSLFAKSVCMTQSQWKEHDNVDENHKDRLIDQYNRSAIPSPPVIGGG